MMMSRPKEMPIESIEQEREAFLRNIRIPQPEDVFFTLPGGDPDKAIALLESWCESDDAEEQRETFAYLKRVLDEDRLSERKLFP
jgi:hypothetical protein